MESIKVLIVVGARPNFMKMAPLLSAIKKNKKFDALLLHTGQHYDYKMSKIFFENLGIKQPDIYLKQGGGSHAEQTANIMLAFEPLLKKHSIDLVIVAGDVNSTLACTLVAAKLYIPVAHIEAGLRSFDRNMPEEINRILTDSISQYLFTTCEDANINLLKEGIDPKKISFVGNLMIDTLFHMLPQAKKSVVHKRISCPDSYGLITLHRPSNVDDPIVFDQILHAFETIQKDLPLIWPMHPRTKKSVETYNLQKRFKNMKNLKILEPLGYTDNLSLMAKAKVVLTDSGGIQEETTALSIPCLTLRNNTERPITITEGTNRLVGIKSESILSGYQAIDSIHTKTPPLWDGKTADRIVKVLENHVI